MGEELGAAGPTDAASLNREGRELLNHGHYEEAIELFSKALTAKPDFYDAYRNRAEAYRNLGRIALAESDMEAWRLAGGQTPRPWHQTWWATAIWLWIPLAVWYGLYVFFAKLRWKERGAVVGTYVGVLVSIVVVAQAGYVSWLFEADESRLPSNDYEKQVVVLVARSRDSLDRLGSQLAELQNDPNLDEPSYLAATRPILLQVRNDVTDIKREWAGLEPPSEALEFHSKGAEYWDFEISAFDEFLEAETEEELASAFVALAGEEQKLGDEFNRLYAELLRE